MLREPLFTWPYYVAGVGVMSRTGDCNAPPPLTPPTARRRSLRRSSRPREERGFSRDRSSSSSASPVRRGHPLPGRRVRPPPHSPAGSTPVHGSAPDPSLRFVLDELAVLRSEIAKLSSNTPSAAAEVPLPTADAPCPPSPATFSGFVAEAPEEGEITDVTPRGSVLRQNAKDLGPPDTVSMDIDDQVAGMVNYLFDNGMQDEDYKAISEDVLTTRPKNCPALAPVECNPQILEALKTDARRADSRLKDVCGDIVKAGTILTKSLLALDQVAQESTHPVLEREVNNINGALALLGHANHKNNLARRFLMKREINQKYSHLCSDKLPMSRLLFGDDVSQSTKQIEDSEKLRHKLAPKKPTPVPWRFSSGRSRGFWARSTPRTYSPRFQPYGQGRGGRPGQRQHQLRAEQEPKNARGRGLHRPRR